ncbi:MAG TPA: sensor histidine kinase [Aestuariivirga sp.]|nr:sensor histidine kinase [Aestuariivirga sp.]
MRRGSLRLRLAVAAAISIAAALFLTGLAIIQLFEAQVRERVLNGLENDLLQLAGSITIAADGTISLSRSLADPRYEEPFGGRYWRIDVLPPPGQPAPEPLRSRSLWDSDLDPANPQGPEGETLVVARRELKVERDGNALELSMIAAAHEDEIQRPLSELRDQLIVALGIIGVVLAIGAWFQVTVGLRPLQHLRDQVAAIRKGTAHILSGTYPDEVSPLVQELNDVLELRDKSLDRARRRAGDLAHGLKTPLTVLRSIARDLRKEDLGQQANDIETQADAMFKHVERALARARLSSGRGHGTTDLRSVAERVIATIGRVAENVEFDIEVPPATKVPFEQNDLTELLGNLLDNASKWANSKVRLTYASGVIAIEDDGLGVDEDKLTLISERGRRLDESKQGSGLGLSIVEDIADIYGLAVSFGRSDMGGLRVEIRL